MSKCYLDTEDKTLCTGCRACEQVCPKNAIIMNEDNEGYIFPEIDSEKCVNCDMCRKVCPVNEHPNKEEFRQLYAAQSKNKDELKESTSGGMFITIAKDVIKDGGVVFGCVIDEDFNVKIVPALKYEELKAMQGSKYVQADTGDTYKQAKEYLEKGYRVLYTGTPCQIAALKKYLGKEYDNLIAMDFLCHGVPSNKLFKENVKHLEKCYRGRISEYKFRDKTKKGWCMMTSFKTSNGLKKYQQGRINGFANAFTRGWIDRECCYKCKFVGTSRCSDITIGDFWGIKNDENLFDLYNGVSFVMVNSEKGEAVMDKAKSEMIVIKKDMAEAFSGNVGALKGNERNLDFPTKRYEIYKNLSNYEFLAEGILKPKDIKTLIIKQNIPDHAVRITKKIKQVLRRK